MNITPEQLKAILEEVIDDRLEEKIAPKFSEMKEEFDSLRASMDQVTKTWNDHLKNEWPVHTQETHGRIDRRLRRHDDLLQVNTDAL